MIRRHCQCKAKIRARIKKLFCFSFSVVFLICMAFPAHAAWSTDWTQWDQIDGSDWLMQTYGCFVVAQARMLVAMGIESADTFNPDIFREWEVANGYLDTEFYQSYPADSPIAYAAQKGETVHFVASQPYPEKSQVLEYIEAGYYIIIKINNGTRTGHWVFVDNETSLAQSDIYFFQSAYGIRGSQPLSLQITEAYVWSYEAEPAVPKGAEIAPGARVIPDGIYCIVTTKDKSHQIDIDGGKMPAENGDDVKIWPNIGENMPDYDLWTVQLEDNGYYSIRQKNTNMCLDVLSDDGSELLSGTNVQVWEYVGGANQQWVISENGEGYRIQSRCSGFSLDFQDASIGRGTPVTQCVNNDSEAQRWSFIPYNDEHLNYFNGHTYKVIEHKLSWDQAQKSCELKGGYLATITSQQEQDFVDALNSSNIPLWIGGYKDDQERWVWITGESWDYSHWGEGEPNNSSNVMPDENCAAVWPSWWNDLNNDNTSEISGYICEWDGEPPTGLFQASFDDIPQLPSFTASADSSSAAEIGPGAQVIPDGTYLIVPTKNQQYCLDIYGEAITASNNDDVKIWPISDPIQNYDLWTVKYEENGYYSIKQKNTDMSLDVARVSGSEMICGTNILAWSYHGEPNQQWVISENGDGYRIQVRCSGYSVDFADGVIGTGTDVRQWESNDSDSQRWTFIPYKGADEIGPGERIIPDGTYLIVPTKDQQYCLDIYGEAAVASNNDDVKIWPIVSDPVPDYDLWTVKYEEDGYYSIKQKNTDMSLDVARVSGSEMICGTNILAWSYHGGPNQQWVISKNGDGYRIQVRCSGYSVDFADGVIGTGTDVRQWESNDSDSQRWTFIPYENGQAVTQGSIIYDDAFSAKIAELQSRYVDGEYWNYYNSPDLSRTGTIACPSCSSRGLTYCLAEQKDCPDLCGQFYWPGIYTETQSTHLGGQCHAYALRLGYEVFGNNPASWGRHYDASRIVAGDIIRGDFYGLPHTIFVYHVEGDTVYFTDCNAIGPCQVRWGGTFSKGEIAGVTGLEIYHLDHD